MYARVSITNLLRSADDPVAATDGCREHRIDHIGVSCEMSAKIMSAVALEEDLLELLTASKLHGNNILAFDKWYSNLTNLPRSVAEKHTLA